MNVGTTVEFRNTGQVVHEVSTDASVVQDKADVSLPPDAKPFDSGFTPPGQSWSYTFTVPTLSLRLHSSRKGPNGRRGIGYQIADVRSLPMSRRKRRNSRGAPRAKSCAAGSSGSGLGCIQGDSGEGQPSRGAIEPKSKSEFLAAERARYHAARKPPLSAYHGW